jgi:hypothetical protein
LNRLGRGPVDRERNRDSTGKASLSQHQPCQTS